VRLFVAFELPEGVREEAGRRAAEARRALPPARWVRAEGLHLTLKFLGETDPGALAALGAGLTAAFAAAPAMTARLDGAGGFPSGRPARVAWIGVAGADVSDAGSANAHAADACDALGALQERVAAVAEEAAGAERERRPFSPHVTVARPDPPWPRTAIESFIARFTAAPGSPLAAPFPLAAGSLVESVLGAGGSRYRTVATFPLAAA
jgi:RNA 2',3'-cyclic 3'-phosphodiesterase